MAAGNGKRGLEEILEEHLVETRAGFATLDARFATLDVRFATLDDGLTQLRSDMNEGFRALRTEMIGGLAQVRTELRGELGELRTDMNAGFARIEGRFDNLLVTSGSRAADHEERITALEADVAKLKTG